MLNLTKHKKYIENLSSSQTTIDFILDEIRKMSQVDKIKAIVELTFVKNIRGVKYLLPLNKYREQLQIADQIITPLKYIIDAELNQLESDNSTKNVKFVSHCLSTSRQKEDKNYEQKQKGEVTFRREPKEAKQKALNEVNLLSNFNNWG